MKDNEEAVSLRGEEIAPGVYKNDNGEIWHDVTNGKYPERNTLANLLGFAEHS